METINLPIPDMRSPHCQTTVTNIVKTVGGKVKSIAPAKAEIELKNGVTKAMIVRAIQKAGYNVAN